MIQIKMIQIVTAISRSNTKSNTNINNQTRMKMMKTLILLSTT